MRALKNSKMKIVEPIASFSINIPKDYLNILISTLSSLNAKFEILDNNTNKITIT
jgi:translation elongation factor EF-G